MLAYLLRFFLIFLTSSIFFSFPQQSFQLPTHSISFLSLFSFSLFIFFTFSFHVSRYGRRCPRCEWLGLGRRARAGALSSTRATGSSTRRPSRSGTRPRPVRGTRAEETTGKPPSSATAKTSNISSTTSAQFRYWFFRQTPPTLK